MTAVTFGTSTSARPEFHVRAASAWIRAADADLIDAAELTGCCRICLWTASSLGFATDLRRVALLQSLDRGARL